MTLLTLLEVIRCALLDAPVNLPMNETTYRMLRDDVSEFCHPEYTEAFNASEAWDNFVPSREYAIVILRSMLTEFLNDKCCPLTESPAPYCIEFLSHLDATFIPVLRAMDDHAQFAFECTDTKTRLEADCVLCLP